MIDRVMAGFDLSRVAAITLLLCLVLPLAPRAQEAPPPGSLTLVRLGSATVRWISRPVQVEGQMEDHGHMELTAVVAETLYGKADRRTVKVVMTNGFSTEGKSLFALIDAARGLSVWQDTTELGLCLRNDEVEDYFDPDPNLRLALDRARRKYPCRPVPELTFTLKSGARVKVSSASMGRDKVATRSASIANQSWAAFCGRYAAVCDNGGLYDLSISLEPSYCIVLVRKRDNRKDMRAYPSGADYRCNPAYQVSRDTTPGARSRQP
jgi:hypothetical protein